MQCMDTRSLEQYQRYHPAATVVAAASGEARDLAEKVVLMALVCAFWGTVLFLALVAAVR